MDHTLVKSRRLGGTKELSEELTRAHVKLNDAIDELSDKFGTEVMMWSEEKARKEAKKEWEEKLADRKKECEDLKKLVDE
jgi:TorA maturation chaperone TorD